MSSNTLSEAFDSAFPRRAAFGSQSTLMTKWLDRHISILTFAGIGIVGVGLHYLRPHLGIGLGWLNETRELLSHACIVAAVLGVTVDSFLKKALIRDVGSIFIGWALPQEVRNYIKDISQTALVRRNGKIDYVLREDGQDVIVDTTHQWDTFNYSTGIVMWRPTFATDLHENPDESAIELEITDGRKTKRWTAKELNTYRKRERTEQLIRWHSPKLLRLMPREVHDLSPACHVRWKHRMKVPRNYSTIASFGTPTIGVTVTAECPTGGLDIDCKATEGMQHAAGSSQWIHPRLFYGAHIRIYWRPKESSDLTGK